MKRELLKRDQPMGGQMRLGNGCRRCGGDGMEESEPSAKECQGEEGDQRHTGRGRCGGGLGSKAGEFQGAGGRGLDGDVHQMGMTPSRGCSEYVFYMPIFLCVYGSRGG